VSSEPPQPEANLEAIRKALTDSFVKIIGALTDFFVEAIKLLSEGIKPLVYTLTPWFLDYVKSQLFHGSPPFLTEVILLIIDLTLLIELCTDLLQRVKKL
jgi:hypothetical protein